MFFKCLVCFLGPRVIYWTCNKITRQQKMKSLQAYRTNKWFSRGGSCLKITRLELRDLFSGWGVNSWEGASLYSTALCFPGLAFKKKLLFPPPSLPLPCKPPSMTGLLLQLNGFPFLGCPPMCLRILGAADTDDLVAKAPVVCFSNGGAEYGPFALNVPFQVISSPTSQKHASSNQMTQLLNPSSNCS